MPEAANNLSRWQRFLGNAFQLFDAFDPSGLNHFNLQRAREQGRLRSGWSGGDIPVGLGFNRDPSVTGDMIRDARGNLVSSALGLLAPGIGQMAGQAGYNALGIPGAIGAQFGTDYLMGRGADYLADRWGGSGQAPMPGQTSSSGAPYGMSGASNAGGYSVLDMFMPSYTGSQMPSRTARTPGLSESMGQGYSFSDWLSGLEYDNAPADPSYLGLPPADDYLGGDQEARRNGQQNNEPARTDYSGALADAQWHWMSRAVRDFNQYHRAATQMK